MTCTKTGARVLLREYDCVVAADLYAVGDCTIIRTHPDAIRNANHLPDAPFTHAMVCDRPGSSSWIRKDLGVFVVPKDMIEEVTK